MCGIIGTTSGNTRAVSDSLATFSYRGPDAVQYFSDARIALGHARLSIIDLDSRAHQPFFDESKEIGIVFNGEIYNYQELRKTLEGIPGVRFRTTSDTEVLVNGYRVWGPALLPKLRGMFAFAIYDLRDNSVFLARDHAGIKPLYFSLEQEELRFASELKGIATLFRREGVSMEVDKDAISLYPVLGYIPSPLTLIRGVQKLARGTWLRYDLTTKKVVTETWTPTTIDITSRAELEDAIRRSVLEHCVADVPIGAFFSGGVDSSLIAAILREAGTEVSTFSIQVAGRPADEPYFRDIARELGVKAHIAEFGLREFEDMYQDLLTRIDDPIADTSIFPTTFVARLASKEVKVVLSGEGGDELFLGYPRTIRLAHMKQARTSSLFDTTYLESPSFPGKNRIFSQLAASERLASSYYLLATSPARDLSSLQGWKLAQELLQSKQHTWFDRDLYLENMLLRKTDMATSYASIEGRVPLLGAELWNAAPGFAAENLIDGKTILKDMLGTFIPRALIDRPKAGFGLDIETLFEQSKHLRQDLHEAIPGLRACGVQVSEKQERVIAERYPVYGFGLVTLHNALKNLGLL